MFLNLDHLTRVLHRTPDRVSKNVASYGLCPFLEGVPDLHLAPERLESKKQRTRRILRCQSAYSVKGRSASPI